jgi:hypothetical protein
VSSLDEYIQKQISSCRGIVEDHIRERFEQEGGVPLSELAFNKMVDEYMDALKGDVEESLQYRFEQAVDRFFGGGDFSDKLFNLDSFIDWPEPTLANIKFT